MDFKICLLSSHVSSLNFYVKLFYFKAFFLVVSLDIRSQAALYQKLKKKKKRTAGGSIRRRLHTTKGLS